MKPNALFRYDPHCRNEIAGIVRGTGATASLSDLIRTYARLEQQWDEAITRQDALHRSLQGRQARDMQPANVAHLPMRSVSADAGRLTARPYEEFRDAVELAQKCIRNALPLTTRRFIENLDRPEISELEALDRQITRLKAEMHAQEAQILEFLPQSLEDVSAKLKFVVSVMLDGQPVENDYIAFLVDECAEVMDGKIGHLRRAVSIAS